MSLKEDTRKFLEGNEEKITTYYKPKRRGNLGAEWYRWRNPFVMLIRGALNEIIKVLPPCNLKNGIYRIFFGVKIGKDVVISPFVHFDSLFPELITIDDNAILGWGSKFITHDVYQDKLNLGRIHIGKKAIVGGFALVQLGTKVGDNATVGKCSLSLKDVPDGDVVGGVPAKSIMHKIKVK